jgi:hypothetical protein
MWTLLQVLFKHFNLPNKFHRCTKFNANVVQYFSSEYIVVGIHCCICEVSIRHILAHQIVSDMDHCPLIR